MPKFLIEYGVGRFDYWEEIEADSYEHAMEIAGRLCREMVEEQMMWQVHLEEENDNA